MNHHQEITIIGLLILSFVFFLVPGIIAFIKSRFLSGRRKKSEIGTMLIFSAFLILSIWFLRYAIGYFSIVTEASGQNLTMSEEFLNSFFATLRTFSLEEEYSDYILSVKSMFSGIALKDNVYFTLTQNLLIVYASILNLVAPILGGAIIFEILASVFPKIKMQISYVAFWRKKYFFSELNEASVALASGIFDINKSHFKKPIIIFTDAYIDDEDEKRAELLSEAKAIGAICVKDDISHVRKNRCGSRAFLLMDENESSNLQTLTDLSDKYNSSYLKDSEIFFVTNSDAYIEIERRVYDKLTEDFHFTDEEVPTFIPVQSYRNLISNLLVEIPLFEPLIDKNEKDELTVTILGTGHIGTEMFLTTYWIGQILNCTLNINIVSEESEAAFWNKIDYVNPEIKHTTIVDDPVLRVNRNGDMASPYCNVNYICCDAKSSRFIEYIDELPEQENILDTDYYFISLGTDELNVSVSNKIKNAVGKHHISQRNGSKTVIAYVVYDPTISEILNRKNLFSFAGETADILMRAVGNLNDVYNAKNIFLSDYEMSAQKIDNAYLLSQGQKIRAEIHKKRMLDDYKHWANLARSMHIKYKMFSMGIFYDSAFNFKSLDDEKYKKSVEVALNRYKRIVSGQIDFENPEEAKAHADLLNELAWLEHRRWNAFTRVKGFKHTDDYDAYATSGQIGSYKQMELKLHPCLVECDKKGMRVKFNEKGKTDESTPPQNKDKADFDLLDDLSYDLYEKGYNNYDFKQYDCPIADF